MNRHFDIRLIQVDDAKQILEIYAPYVLETPITFEYTVPSLKEYIERISINSKFYPWLVVLLNGAPVGFAYAAQFRSKIAYQWSPEATIYLDPEVHGKGIARILYETLFSVLILQGFYNLYAGVAIPNESSENLHSNLGFEDIGIYKNIAYKHGSWHSTRWFQKTLQPHVTDPNPPRGINEIEQLPEFKTILETACKRMNVKR